MVTDVRSSPPTHITEPPDTYRPDRRALATGPPCLVRDAKRGDLFVIDGLDKQSRWGLSPPRASRRRTWRVRGPLEDLHRRLGPRSAARGPGARRRRARCSTRPWA
jgi:hypothetical protein